jgi:prophage maintenance system killer protein
VTSYIDADFLIAINDLESGQGIRDRHGIEAAVGRPWTTFGGIELYPTPEEKAGVLFHSLASTQYFVDGNKRPAWLAATFLYHSLGEEIRPTPVVAKEAFALVTSTLKDWDESKAAEWFKEHRVIAADRLDYALLSMDARLEVPGPGMWSGMGNSLARLQSPGFPAVMELYAIFRVRWRKSDIGREAKLTFRTAPRNGADGTPVAVIRAADGIEDGLTVLHTGHVHHRDGVMPLIHSTRLVLDLFDEGSIAIVAEVDGEHLFSAPLSTNASMQAPDALPASWLG